MIMGLRFVERVIIENGMGRKCKILQAYDGSVWSDVPFEDDSLVEEF
jgi:hypothetical protein